MRFATSLLLLLVCLISYAQNYTRQDSLRGTITPEREWWDASHYHLDINIDTENGTIEGSNKIRYKVLSQAQVMQLDLQPPMEITKITQDKNKLLFKRDGNAYFIQLRKKQEPGDFNEIVVEYNGKPRIAPRPPWDSGMVWKKDSLGNTFAASVSWGAGSSQWWPLKDHNYDEADSMRMSFTVRNDLVAVGNGRFLGKEENKDQTTTFHWSVRNPINSYGVNFNIGNYVNFSEVYEGEKGPLDCDYWVLEHNLEKAKNQFAQVPKMLEAFEYWFGPYPFYEDSYKLVEVPYLGMEHQSATAYGNGYKNGFNGRRNGWGSKFDYIIIHESGHEWFACNISFKDIADIWIHESFTTYSESLYVEHVFGKEAGFQYALDTRGAANDRPMIGHYDINDISYTGDNYQKGAGILHTLRQVINDDEKWRSILRGLNKEFYHATVTTEQVENFIAEKSGLNLDAFWDQYLRTTQIPTLEFRQVGNRLFYKWINTIETFDMPIKVFINGKETWLKPKPYQMQGLDLDSEIKSFEVDPHFYVSILNHNVR